MSTELNELKVMSWNVLARPFTYHGLSQHKYDPIEIGNRIENKKQKYEHIEQTLMRFIIILNFIITKSPDIILLQEVDYSLKWFLKKKFNEKNIQYKIYYDNSKKDFNSVSTAIIYKSDKFQEIGSAMIGKNNTNTYLNKDSKVLLLNIIGSNKKIIVSSIHFPGINNATPEFRERCIAIRTKLLTDTIEKIAELKSSIISNVSESDIPIIIGGDFNNNLRNENSSVNILKSQRFNTNNIRNTNKVTTCSFNYGHHQPAYIDKIFYKNITFRGIEIEDRTCNDGIITYNNSKGNKKNEIYSNVKYGSDHLWILGTYVL